MTQTIRKISGNIKRDSEIDKELFGLGWTVIRFWGKDILKHTDECVRAIEEKIKENEYESLL